MVLNLADRPQAIKKVLVFALLGLCLGVFGVSRVLADDADAANIVDLIGKKSDSPQPQPVAVATYVPPHEAHRQEVARHNAQPAGIQSHAPAPVNYDDDIPY